jgi:hypothetical protein
MEDMRPWWFRRVARKTTAHALLGDDSRKWYLPILRIGLYDNGHFEFLRISTVIYWFTNPPKLFYNQFLEIPP